jgi:uncharacterized DUF497 family protein
VEFDWDEANEEHIARHGVAPEEAEEALIDPRRLRMPAYDVEGEERRAVLGATEDGRVLFVVYTRRRGRLRVITARDAHPVQRRRYRR